MKENKLSKSKKFDIAVIGDEVVKVLAKHHLTTWMAKNVLKDIHDHYLDHSSVVMSRKKLEKHVYDKD